MILRPINWYWESDNEFETARQIISKIESDGLRLELLEMAESVYLAPAG